jgi:ribosomal protein L11 methyltransferase
MELWEIRLEIAAGAADAAELALLEAGLEGWHVLEDSIARKAWIVGFFKSSEEAEARRAELGAALPSGASADSAPRRLSDGDWRLSYRDHFKAWACGRLHWVPVWERATFRLPEGHSVLWLDPGMAFGTGNHETTRLCIERLVEFEADLSGGPAAAAKLSVVDAGCGSGILALSACLLGFRDVSGFDIDPEAVRISMENAGLNGLSGRVRFATSDLEGGLAGAGAAVVLANIQADILVRHAGDLTGAVAPGGLLAMSGILSAESPDVRKVFERAAPGWASDSRVLGEWCDLCLRRPCA